MIAPKPANWRALCDAWNDPIEFQRQVAIYMQQLSGIGYPDTTEPPRKVDA